MNKLPPSPNAVALGSALKGLRNAKALTLRFVEKNTGISNAYLSQLETGRAENPSPAMLKKLAEVYGASYESLMQAAGYLPVVRDLFLSHRSANKDFVRELGGDIEAETFEGRPLLVWLDEAEIRPGDSIPGAVSRGLEQSRFIAIVMTPEYFESAGSSGWTDAEWHAALHQDPDNRKARILPLLAKDCPYVPYLLRHLRAIDFRGNRYDHALKELLAVLKNEPLPRPVTHRGQLVTSGSRIDRSSLVAERAVPDADPDVVTERLFCNLLPVERLPRYVYMGGIEGSLFKTRKDGKQTAPSKNRLKEIVRAEQERGGVPPEKRFMPAFRTFEDRIITFHDLEDPDGPLGAVVDENDIETLDVPSLARDEDSRNLLLSLLNMSLSRHMKRSGLIIDEEKQHRYFFPSRDGGANTITWTPRKNKAVRTVAKPVTKDGRVMFWRHLGAYLRVIFLVNKFYIKITPTWVITEDGEHPSAGPEVSRRVVRWTNPERNLQILFHVRFWTSVLRNRKAGPISIRTGDQTMEVATKPAWIQQAYGIDGDERDLMKLLDEEAPLLAAEEDEQADEALEIADDEDEAEDDDWKEFDEESSSETDEDSDAE